MKQILGFILGIVGALAFVGSLLWGFIDLFSGGSASQATFLLLVSAMALTGGSRLLGVA